MDNMNDSERKFYVYAYLRAKDSVNGDKGTPYYVGKGQGKRAFDKSHSVPVPKDAANIIILADGMTEADSFQAEMLLIQHYGRVDLGTGKLHNRTDGGEGGSNPSPEKRKAISDKLKAQGIIPPSQKGTKQDPEMVAERARKVSATHRANNYTPKMAGWNRGLKTGPSWSKGVTFSQEHRKNMSKARLGFEMTQDIVDDVRHQRREGKKLKDIALQYHLKESYVSQLCLGKTWPDGSEPIKVNNSVKMTPDKWEQVMVLRADGVSVPKIAQMFGVDASLIYVRLRKAA